MSRGNTYSILKHGDGIPETVFTTTIFDKPRIQAEFDRLAGELKDGETLEYLKADRNFYHCGLLVVTRETGNLWRETPTGRLVPYTPKEPA